MQNKRTLWIGFVLIIVCITGCSKKQEATGIITDAGSGEASLPETVQAVILSSTTLLELRDDGFMHYVNKPLNTGDTVIWKDEQKTAQRNTDKAERDFFRVEIDGGDYWVQRYLIAPDAVPGIIVNGETVLYSRADLAAPAASGLTTIPQYTIVAVHPRMESGVFTAVSAYLEGTNSPVVEAKFIKKENVTTSQNDVQAMRLYLLAQAAKNDVVKKELLKNAAEMYSRFNDLILPALAVYEPAAEESMEAPDVFSDNPFAWNELDN